MRDPQFIESIEREIARARDAGDLWWQCGLLGNLGMLNANIGRMKEARRCFEQSLALAQQLGDRRSEGNNLCNLGMLHFVQHELSEAIEASERALRVARDLGHRRLEGVDGHGVHAADPRLDRRGDGDGGRADRRAGTPGG